MFDRAIRVGRIAGVEIRIDASWLVIAALIAWVFFARIDELYDDLEVAEEAALAAGAAAVFFASVLVHELAHSLVARRRGIEVEGITLFLFGGATESRVESKEPRDELLIAAVGPLTSFLVAGVLWAVAVVVGSPGEAVAGTIGFLAWLNLALAVFNVLPGFPLDGGRVLRAIVWWVTGDLGRATRVAATGGRVLGYGLIGIGLLSVLAGGLGGLWLAAIGWFLTQAARMSETQTLAREALEGLGVRDVMSADPVTIPEETPLDAAVNDWFLRRDHSAFPVTRGSDTVGLLTLRAVRRVDPHERASLRVADVMTDLADVPVVDAGASAEEVFDHVEEPGARLLVRDGARIVGIVTPSDIARRVRRFGALGGTGGSGRVADGEEGRWNR